MIRANVYQFTGTEKGSELPAYAWPGGYPIAYLAKDGATLCPKCVNEECRGGGSEDCPGDAQWTIVDAFVHWEGPPEVCEHCGEEIESAYGDPDNPDEI